MSREFGDYIADVLNAAREVEQFTCGMSFEVFAADKKTVNAVIRSLEVMGEAAKRIGDDIRLRYPGIPWRRMAGMRDKLCETSGQSCAVLEALSCLLVV